MGRDPDNSTLRVHRQPARIATGNGATGFNERPVAKRFFGCKAADLAPSERDRAASDNRIAEDHNRLAQIERVGVAKRNKRELELAVIQRIAFQVPGRLDHRQVQVCVCLNNVGIVAVHWWLVLCDSQRDQQRHDFLIPGGTDNVIIGQDQSIRADDRARSAPAWSRFAIDIHECGNLYHRLVRDGSKVGGFLFRRDTRIPTGGGGSGNFHFGFYGCHDCARNNAPVSLHIAAFVGAKTKDEILNACRRDGQIQLDDPIPICLLFHGQRRDRAFVACPFKKIGIKADLLYLGVNGIGVGKFQVQIKDLTLLNTSFRMFGADQELSPAAYYRSGARTDNQHHHQQKQPTVPEFHVHNFLRRISRTPVFYMKGSWFR